MTKLGEKIYEFRTQNNMSQGDLADALNVSRQSISKWETNSSVPELDKLIKMSEIFGISLDELVLDKKLQIAEEAGGGDYGTDYSCDNNSNNTESNSNSNRQKSDGVMRKVVGTILMCFGFFFLLFFTLWGGIIAGVLISTPFLLCGVICITIHNKPGLWCAWTIYYAINQYLSVATGITWKTIRLTAIWTPDMNYMRLWMAWGLFFLMIAMMIITIFSYRKDAYRLEGKKLIKFISCIGIWMALVALSYIIQQKIHMGIRWSEILLNIIDVLRTGLITTIIVMAISTVRAHRQNH